MESSLINVTPMVLGSFKHTGLFDVPNVRHGEEIENLHQ